MLTDSQSANALVKSKAIKSISYMSDEDQENIKTYILEEVKAEAVRVKRTHTMLKSVWEVLFPGVIITVAAFICMTLLAALFISENKDTIKSNLETEYIAKYAELQQKIDIAEANEQEMKDASIFCLKELTKSKSITETE